MKIANREIGENKPIFMICEGGVTNYGQMDLAKKQIDSAIAANADAIKFQAWKTENLVSRKSSDRLKKELKFDWFQRLKEKEFSYEELTSIHKYASEKGIFVFSTPHDDSAIELLDSVLDVPLFKVGSGEAHNYAFLKKIGQCKKPVLISFGFQNDKEIIEAIEVLQKAGAPDIIALHCVSLYPTPYEYAQLKKIEHLRELLDIPIGISDHSIGWHIPLAAVSLGICVIEKHLTFDKNDPKSLDNPGALLPDEFKVFIEQVRDVEKGMRVIPEQEHMELFAKARHWLGQCIVAGKDIPQGTILTEDDIAFKRPSLDGLPPSELEKIVGMKVKEPIEKDEQIQLENLE